MPAALPDIFFLIILGTSVWVGVDASSRDLSRIPVADKTWKWVHRLARALDHHLPGLTLLARRSTAPDKRSRGQAARMAPSSPTYQLVEHFLVMKGSRFESARRLWLSLFFCLSAPKATQHS